MGIAARIVLAIKQTDGVIKKLPAAYLSTGYISAVSFSHYNELGKGRAWK